ncbi:group-specific protein [Lysinibacillus sp. NPDC097195]|uniref:group-specific protein n=1 Tax=Lysinibacillus sp. NPDC097195 TaxID=3364141 RepID=UPI0038166B8F
MGNFIYHMVPQEMIGNMLIPLNSLKQAYPHLYEKYSMKYYNHPERANLLKRQVPKLNCLWNDVLHFLPIHPYSIYETITSLGIEPKANLQFYKIPIQNLKFNYNAMYLYSKENYRGPSEEINQDEIRIIDIDDYKEITELPLATIEYYRTEKEQGSDFGLFPFIPHLLSHGEVAIQGVEIIQWNKP